MAERVCVGRIAAPHGVRGLVKVKSFTENPRDLTAYGDLSDELDKAIKLVILSGGKEEFIARIEGVSDRTGAEAHKGKNLYIDRAALPACMEREYYQADLIGLSVMSHDGRELGRVTALHDFGAGDILEVTGDSNSIMLPFTRAFVPEVDLARKRIVLAEYTEIT